MGDMEINDGESIQKNEIILGGDVNIPEKEHQIPKEVLEKLDKTIFFSASAARSKTDSVYKKKIEVQMLEIYNLINEAINEGKYAVENIALTDGEKRFLQGKGYNISYTGTFNNTSKYKIYW